MPAPKPALTGGLFHAPHHGARGRIAAIFAKRQFAVDDRFAKWQHLLINPMGTPPMPTTQPITLQQARQNAAADEAFQAFVNRPRSWLTVLAERIAPQPNTKS